MKIPAPVSYILDGTGDERRLRARRWRRDIWERGRWLGGGGGWDVGVWGWWGGIGWFRGFGGGGRLRGGRLGGRGGEAARGGVALVGWGRGGWWGIWRWGARCLGWLGMWLMRGEDGREWVFFPPPPPPPEEGVTTRTSRCTHQPHFDDGKGRQWKEKTRGLPILNAFAQTFNRALRRAEKIWIIREKACGRSTMKKKKKKISAKEPFLAPPKRKPFFFPFLFFSFFFRSHAKGIFEEEEEEDAGEMDGGWERRGYFGSWHKRCVHAPSLITRHPVPFCWASVKICSFNSSHSSFPGTMLLVPLFIPVPSLQESVCKGKEGGLTLFFKRPRGCGFECRSPTLC